MSNQETLCRHCDHFVSENPAIGASVVVSTTTVTITNDDGGTETLARYVHAEDGEQAFDHDAEPGESHRGQDWARLRPDLFIEHPDGKVGPNSIHHLQRGKKARRADKIIRAEVHTDDHRAEASFDAVEWFEQASDQDIIDLAGCSWGGDYPADDVAEFMADHDSNVADVFKFLETYNRGPARDRQGFECHVNSDDAIRWLKEHKPTLVPQLKRDGD